MTDERLREICAEAMGWKHLGAVGILPKPGETKNDYANRGDALKKRWCWSEQNDWWDDPEGHSVCGPCQSIPDPLTDDVAAMALVKRLRLAMIYDDEKERWIVGPGGVIASPHDVESADLNRAIVECVAKMQSSPNDILDDGK